MKAKHAKGFTLIEVLVVVVIMGILAAVAVPKLFGNVAKAKSSELPIAASTYMKLQDISVGLHSAIGNWKNIGYEAPGKNRISAYFQYGEGEITDSIISFSDLGDGKIGWQATNTIGLNRCEKGSWWTITLSEITGKSQLNYEAMTSSDNCLRLASVFSKGNVSGVEITEETSSVPVGTNLFASATNTQKVGTWHESGVYKEANSAWHSIHNANNTSGPFPGTYELEANTEYTFTIAIPEDVWKASENQYMQTEIRVFTENDQKFPAIMLASRPEDQKAATDPGVTGYVYEKDAAGNSVYQNGNGYNTGSGRNNGYTAESTMKTENGMVVTTVTFTTGNDGGYFGANIFGNGKGGGWTAGRESAVNTAISNATLVKTGTVTKEEKEEEKK